MKFTGEGFVLYQQPVQQLHFFSQRFILKRDVMLLTGYQLFLRYCTDWHRIIIWRKAVFHSARAVLDHDLYGAAFFCGLYSLDSIII